MPLTLTKLLICDTIIILMKNKNQNSINSGERSSELDRGPINITLEELVNAFALIRPENNGDYDSANFTNMIDGSTELHLYSDGSSDADFYDSAGLHLGTVMSSNTAGYEDEAPQGVFIQSHESNKFNFSDGEELVYVHNLRPGDVNKILESLTPKK